MDFELWGNGPSLMFESSNLTKLLHKAPAKHLGIVFKAQYKFLILAMFFQ